MSKQPKTAPETRKPPGYANETVRENYEAWCEDPEVNEDAAAETYRVLDNAIENKHYPLVQVCITTLIDCGVIDAWYDYQPLVDAVDAAGVPTLEALCHPDTSIQETHTAMQASPGTEDEDATLCAKRSAQFQPPLEAQNPDATKVSDPKTGSNPQSTDANQPFVDTAQTRINPFLTPYDTIDAGKRRAAVLKLYGKGITSARALYRAIRAQGDKKTSLQSIRAMLYNARIGAVQ